MRRLSAPVMFGLSAFAWIVVLTLAWTKVSPWTSYPVGKLTQFALEQSAPVWVRSVRVQPGHVEADSSIAMPVPSAGGRLAEATVESDPGRYAYGLPVFLALLLAARGRRRMARGLAGYLLLLPAQTFSASMFLLMQIVLYAQTRAQVLGVPGWQVEAIVYAYQMGALVVPTLAPIMLWLWLDRQFVAEVLVPGWRGESAAERPVAADSAAVPERASGRRSAYDANTDGAHGSRQAAPQVAPSARAVSTGPSLPSTATHASPAQISSSASAGLPLRK